MYIQRAHYRQVRLKKLPLLKFRRKVFYSILVAVALIFLLRYILWWTLPQHIPSNWIGAPFHFFDVMLYLLITFVVFIGYVTAIATWFAFWFASKPKYLAPPKKLRIAFLTCYVPHKEPVSMLKSTLSAIKDVNYPHDTWVLDEGNSEEVIKLCKEMGVYHFSRKSSRRFNKGIFRAKTKGGNHNAWRHHHEYKYDFVAQIDMDHKPRKNYFERTLGYFRDPKVAIIGMPEVYKKTDNWILKGCSEQSALFHYAMQSGYFGCDMPFLIGTSHIYRVSAMKYVNGYAPTIVEDHLTGMKIYAHKFKGVFVPEILTEGYGPLNWVSYLNQQFRWSYGLFEIFFQHTPFMIWRLNLIQKTNYFLAQTYYFTGVGVVLGTILTSLYLWTGITSINIGFQEWVYYALPPFMMNQIIYSFIRKNSLYPEKIPPIGLRGKLLGLGANITYSLALVLFILRKRFSYSVTTKEIDSQPSPSVAPLKIFSIHITIMLMALFGLIISIFTNHTSTMQRFWGLFAVITMMIVILSNFLPIFEKKYRSIQKFLEMEIPLPKFIPFL